ncbi:MAG: tetratricopeptide repeat protein [Halobacteria archaeon]|nr:tetratricopeptide repeat protein [Halobacteria archaeon]
MSLRTFTWFTGGLLLFFGGISPAMADALSDLPAALADRLVPVAEISLDNLDADSRQQLTAARARLARMVSDNLPDEELAEGWGELGALYQAHLVKRLAGDCYANARKLAPENFRWIYYSAYLADDTGDLVTAVRDYRTARDLRPDYLAVTARLADAWLDLNELEQAKQAYQQVVGARGLEAAAHYGLGQIALLQRDHEVAIEHFRQALEMQPEANRIHYSLARALRAVGENDRAKAHLAQRGDQSPVIKDPQIESLKALRQGAQIHFLQGMKAFRKLDYAAARDAFARGLERDPDNINARISYARTLYLTDARAEAGQLLEAVVATDPTRALAWYLLGSLADETGDTDTAIRHYTTALGHEPDHGGALINLANSHYRQGHPARAVKYYAACVQATPENPAVWLPYAGALMQAGRGRADILAVIETAQQRFPEQPLLDYVKIQLLACSEGPACDADRALDRARTLHDRQPIPPHRELLALAQAATGDFDAAAGVQSDLVSEAMLMMPAVVGRLDATLTGYQAKQLPEPKHLFTWPLLQAPAVDGAVAFRDYLTPRPY